MNIYNLIVKYALLHVHNVRNQIISLVRWKWKQIIKQQKSLKNTYWSKIIFIEPSALACWFLLRSISMLAQYFDANPIFDCNCEIPNFEFDNSIIQ